MSCLCIYNLFGSIKEKECPMFDLSNEEKLESTLKDIFGISAKVVGYGEEGLLAKLLDVEDKKTIYTVWWK